MPRYASHHALVGQTNSAVPHWAVEPALAMFEFSSIAQGMLASDAMVKRSAVQLIHAGTVQPGRYLVLLGGKVAEVEEAMQAGREMGKEALEDLVWLPGVHPDVLLVLHAANQSPPSIKRPPNPDSLGIIETRTAPAAIQAADVAAKGAKISLLSIRLSDGLGGKGLVLLIGAVSDVEAAIELVKKALQGIVLLQTVVIPQLHEDFARNIFGETRFFRK